MSLPGYGMVSGEKRQEHTHAAALLSSSPQNSVLQQDGGKRRRCLISQVNHHIAAIVARAVLPLIGIIAWAARFINAKDTFDLRSHTIGGQLTQTQAKAIDFIAGAVLVPIVLMGLNWYWFSALRVTVFSEKSSRGIPLATVVEASRTDRGSYDILKIAALFRGGPKMIAFAFAVVFSALAQTSFSNMIAYEAFDQSGPSPPVRLRSLLPSIDNSDNVVLGQPYPLNNLTEQQSKALESQVLELLVDVLYNGANTRLSGDVYIGVNATKSAMDGLPAYITELHDVPGYRLSLDCAPVHFESIGFSQMGTLVSATFSESLDANNTALASAQYPGAVVAMTDQSVETLPFVAFPLGPQPQVHPVRFERFNLTTNDPVETPYGRLPYQAFNMSQVYGGPGQIGGERVIMSAIGLKCEMHRQMGSMNMTRQRDLTWTPLTPSWSHEHSNPDLMLGYFQTSLKFQLNDIGGFGPVLWSSAEKCTKRDNTDSACSEKQVDYRELVRNVLFTEAEIERRAHETQRAGSNDSTEAFYLNATMTSQHYRMTYVPALLLTGLLSALVAATIPLALVIAAAQTSSLRNWRDVDSLRLLIDSADGLYAEPEIREAQEAGKAGQERMANGVAVRYSRVMDTDGRIVLRTPSVTRRLR